MFERNYKRLILATACLTVLLYPERTEAHQVTTGLGPVYDGMGHFFLSPGDALAVLALALLAGLRGTAAGRRVLFVLPLAWLIGGFAGLTTVVWTSPMPEEIAGALSLLLLGILIAMDIAMPTAVVAGLAALLGSVHSFFNGLGMHEAGAGSGVLQLAGVAVTVFVLVALAAAKGSDRLWTAVVMHASLTLLLAPAWLTNRMTEKAQSHNCQVLTGRFAPFGTR